MPYKIAEAGGEITLEFAGIVKLLVHFPNNSETREQVMGMIQEAPDQTDPYALMASISHEPVTSIGTLTLK